MRIHHSIGHLLTALSGLLGALLIAVAASNTYSEWRNLRAMQAAAEVNGAADSLLVAIERLTLERGLTFTALNGEAAVAAPAAEAIKTRRQEMRDAMVAGWPVLSGLSYLAEEKLIAKAQSAVAAIDDLRARAEQAIARPRAERDASVQARWYATLTAGIEALTEVWQASSQRLSAIDQEAAAAGNIKYLTALMREYAGRERALLGSGKPVEPQKQIEVADWRARAGQAWELINAVYPKTALPPAIAASLKDAEERYFGKYLPVRDRVYQNLIEGKPAGTSGKDWADISNPGLNAIVAIRDAAISFGSAHLAGRVAAAQKALVFQLFLIALALALTLTVHLVSRSRISAPLVQIAGALRQFTDGKFDAQIPASKRKDEIGDIVKALTLFRDQSLRMKEIERERAGLERKNTEVRRSEMSRLADEFSIAVGAVVDTVSSASGELELAAKTLTGTAEATQGLSISVAGAAQEASMNVQSVSAAAEELESSVSEIARQAQDSSRIAAAAVEQARRTDTHIGELSSAAAKIGDVVKLITEIAAQTNLLALNATIEAARAGDAGKGFAVVAQEVKALAGQTARATDEIGNQMTNIQTATESSIAAIKDINETITRISEIAMAISAAVEEQGATTGEIARSIHQASSGTSKVAADISEVNRAAAETGSASSQVFAAARTLANDGLRLKAEVDKFLQTVRAA